MAALSATGIPIAHLSWPTGSAPELPWMVFYLSDDRRLNADNIRWNSFTEWTVELYQKNASEEVESLVEGAINDSFGDYYKEEMWLDDEQCVMTSYTFTEIERSHNG